MDFRQMRYFVAVVNEKNFSKAAEKLHLSQPSLSNAIMKLENEIGFPLLERNTRSLRLTDSGEVIYKRSVEFLKQYDRLQKEMEEIQEIGNGKLSIGMIESSKHWMPKVILQFKRSYPSVQIQLSEVLGGEEVQKSLLDYETHVVITNQPIVHQDVNTIPIYQERLVLLLHEKNPLGEKKIISMKDLENEAFIISTIGFQTRRDILNAFEKERAEPNIMYESERFETVCSLVEEGLGVTIIPENYIRYSNFSAIRTRQIDSDELQRTVYLTYSKSRYLPPFVHSFCKEIRGFFHTS
ncbi:LysR family transcriptional regulator [Domibacillus mangrovi]|uniref:LysR family transcriptional regulator n=1 Tax=Domibacillus mangrovi TaxID=1714354 RepID=A0A1Q5P1I9_9BACI|nr:LysR family transcriptional regulator [Domibacillus mangrovi]OKL36066.1 LysR family transcriptional regulator [Domibacillus mangrovi]